MSWRVASVSTGQVSIAAGQRRKTRGSPCAGTVTILAAMPPVARSEPDELVHDWNDDGRGATNGTSGSRTVELLDETFRDGLQNPSVKVPSLDKRIEILHLMGATDVQVARLFQRRIALDALFGGLVGFILGGGVLILLGERVTALGSELLGSATIPVQGWAVLVALPILGVLLAMLVARLTILRALGRML